MATLQQGMGAGWKGLGLVRSERGALEIAQAHLAAAGVESPLSDNSRQGITADGYSWEVVAAPQLGSPGITTRPKLLGFWVSVTVRWRETAGLAGERSLSLRTFKLGTAP